jgi:preprotein translocase subunit YajC
VKNLLPLVIIVILFGGLLLLNRRTRERAARQDANRRTRLRPGSQVMTTSGLYATVVALNQDDDSALLSIAPGVEVKWSTTALREMTDLPKRYHPGAAQDFDSGSGPGSRPSRGTGNELQPPPAGHPELPPDPDNPGPR